MKVGVHVSLGRCEDIGVDTFIALYITPNLPNANLPNALGLTIFVSFSLFFHITNKVLRSHA